jgi:hypothetical protein
VIWFLAVVAVVLFVITFPRLALGMVLACLLSCLALIVLASVRQWWLRRGGRYSL